MEIKAWVTAWYRKQDWSRWQAVCKFKGSYDEWLRRAEAGAKEQERLGCGVAKVVIEPDKCLEWCKAKGLSIIDPKARVAYAMTLFDTQQRAND